MVRLTVPAIAPIVVSLVLGAATVFGFAPFGFSALPVLTLSGLFALWRRAASPRTAAWLWTLTEWLRTWLSMGMPWLAVGYAQTQAPLAGYAPLGGVCLVSLAAAASAALVAYIAEAFRPAHRRAAVAAAALLAVWITGFGVRSIEWSVPYRDPVAVSLVQGNIDQDLKFETKYRDQTLAIYAELVAQAKGRLIVLPESALPMFADEVPADYVARLRAAARQRDGDLLMGLFFFEPRTAGEDEDHYFNSVVSVGTAQIGRA